MVAYEDLFFFFAIRDQLAGDWQLTAGLDAGYQNPLWPITSPYATNYLQIYLFLMFKGRDQL
jgi:hypothetical protein